MFKKIRAIVYIIGFFIFRPFSYVVPFRISLKILYRLRKLFYPFLFFRKKKALNLFSLCFPNMDNRTKNRILDKLMWTILLYSLLDIYLDRILGDIYDIIDVDNFQQIRDFVFDNKPFILLFFHNGLQNITLTFSGILNPVYTVVAYFYDKIDIFSKLQNFIRVKMQERSYALRHIYIKKHSLTQFKIVKLLKEGKILAISSDGIYSTKFYEVPFLNGYKILVPSGPYRISTFLEVPILPVFSYFDEKDFKIKIIYGNILKGHDPYLIAKEYWRIFSSFLKKHPEVWTGWWRLSVEKDKILKLSSI